MEWFGNSKADIAREKVGIVKPGGIAVIGDSDPDIVSLLERESRRLGAGQVLTKGVDFACDSNRLALAGRVLTLRTPTSSYSSVFVPLHGSHQGENAATAIVAVEMFLGAPLEPDVVLEGFAAVQNPGRMEVVRRKPLVLLDGAHNPAGARTAAATMSEEFAANPGRIIVMGLLTGRDAGAMLDALEAERAKLVIVVTPPSPRAMDPEVVSAAALERITLSVHIIRERLFRATRALEVASVPYAVIGGNAVAAWVGEVDLTAVRYTQDVDILLRRADLAAERDQAATPGR